MEKALNGLYLYVPLMRGLSVVISEDRLYHQYELGRHGAVEFDSPDDTYIVH